MIVYCVIVFVPFYSFFFYMLDNIFKCIYAKLYAYIYIHIKDTLVEFIFGFLCLPHLAICTHESHSKRFTVLFHSKYILFVLSRFQRDIAIINWRESYIRFIRFCLNTPKRRRTRRTKERWNDGTNKNLCEHMCY